MVVYVPIAPAALPCIFSGVQLDQIFSVAIIINGPSIFLLKCQGPQDHQFWASSHFDILYTYTHNKGAEPITVGESMCKL